MVRLPIEQYQKDGRIIRGLQLGAQSFTARTAMAALELTARIIQFIQVSYFAFSRLLKFELMLDKELSCSRNFYLF